MSCIVCGKEFFNTPGVSSLFCSRECNDDSKVSQGYCIHLYYSKRCIFCKNKSMTSEEKIKIIQRMLTWHRCSDGNCIYGSSTGMHTNGGCASIKGSSMETRKELVNLVKGLRDILEQDTTPPELKKEDLPKDNRFDKLDIE